ncbi:MAG: FtsX-like permease family protein [Chloroflexi bacterium]|nr:FtsX-like permease family protein [Chloroflexota bacterium]
MSDLLRLLSWRHNQRHRLRALLGILSIALAVALYVSIEVAHASAAHAFEQTVLRLAGRADLRVTQGRHVGIDAGALSRIEAVGGVDAAPVLQRSTTLVDFEEGPVLVLGVDFIREARLRDFTAAGDATLNPLALLLDPEAIVTTRTLADRHALSVGSKVRITTPGGLREVRIAGLLEDTGPASIFGGNLAVMSISAAQGLFLSEGRYDRIDVATGGDEAAAERIRRSLGPGYRVEPIGARSSVLNEVLGRVRQMEAVSIIAILVGLFIIYLSISIGVAERTKHIGTVRALGASRAQILCLFLAEAFVLGLAGSVLGLGLGRLAAGVAIKFTAAAVNMFGYLIHVDRVVMPPGVVVAALCAGTLAALAGAWIPARRAARISPLTALRPTVLQMRSAVSYRLGFWVGLPLAAAGSIGIVPAYRHLPAWAGTACAAMVFLGAGLALPQMTLWASLRCRRVLRGLFRIEGDLAVDNITKYPARTSLTVIALTGALAVMIATASIVGSAQTASQRWLADILPFDLSVQANDLSQRIYSSAVLPPETFEIVRSVDGVAFAYGVAVDMAEYGDRDVMVIAIDYNVYRRMLREKGRVLQGPDGGAELAAAMRRGEAGVSLNFARLYGVGPGDSIELPTPTGRRRFRVAHVSEDYSWPQGVVLLDLSVYAELWGNRSLTYIDLAVTPAADVQQVKARIGKALEGDYRTFVYSSRDIRDFAEGFTDQSFKIMYAQVFIAMALGFLGIVNTLLMSVLRRTREIGLLRAVGMTREQVGRTVLVEAMFIAVVAGGLGLVAGLLAAAGPIAAILLHTTGYVLPFTVPWGAMGLAFGATLLLGLVASLIPARRAASLDVLTAISCE